MFTNRNLNWPTLGSKIALLVNRIDRCAGAKIRAIRRAGTSARYPMPEKSSPITGLWSARYQRRCKPLLNLNGSEGTARVCALGIALCGVDLLVPPRRGLGHEGGHNGRHTNNINRSLPHRQKR